jgi:esterase
VTAPVSDRPHVEDKSISVNGLRFHYREWGTVGAPTLILLHGYLCHARMFDVLANLMSDHYRVLALDQRGHGETEWSGEYGPGPLFQDFAAFVKALGLTSVSLLGYSFGGPVAYTFAARYPTQVERLVIVESGGGAMPSPRAEPLLRAWRSMPSTFETPEEAVRAVHQVIYRASANELEHFVRAGLVRQADGRWTWRWDPELLRQSQLAPSPEFMWTTLPQVICPTLYIRGADSELARLELGERIAAAVPHGQLASIPDAGHFPWFDNPTGIMEVIREFLVLG